MRLSRGSSALVAIAILAGCRDAPRQAAPATATAIRSLGTWQGRGSQTVGVVSESGRLRVTWKTSSAATGRGHFRLALHSGVSGRPLHVIVDQRGDTEGSADVSDDPRPFNFMVDSADVDWSFSVEEIVAVARQHP